MAAATLRQGTITIQAQTQFLSPKCRPTISSSLAFITTAPFHHNHHLINESPLPRLSLSSSGHRHLPVLVRASPGQAPGDEDGISLGTIKLSPAIDIPRFEILLYQWANSLNQGAQLPLPCAMKVDKIDGGVRLGFVSIDDGKANVEVYIDCVLIPGSSDSDGYMFRAIRKGARKDKVPPGEPRIMKSLLAALKTSAELART